MATSEKIATWRRALGATFPLIGRIRRRRAIRALAESRENPEAVPVLVESLDSADTEVVTGADSALRGLSSAGSIDVLCGLWAKGRDERLGRLIAERGYVARQPLDARILSGLKCGMAVPTDRANVVRCLVRLLGDADETVRSGAERDVRSCAPGAGQDALCEEVIKDPKGQAARIAVETGKRHSDHEANCLYLFVTRQLDAYFEEDFEFQALRLEYDRADEAVKGHVMEIVRSGDRRCAGFFASGGGGRIGAKPLAECTDREIRLALDSWVRHEQWDRLFRACLELPLKYSWAALEPLRESGWKPDAPEMKSVFDQVLADSAGQAMPEPKEPSAESSLFEHWLEEGKSGERASASEADLLERLTSGDPAQCVPVVAALAGKARPGSAAAKAVAESPHWLVRLAGHAMGLTLDLAQDTVEDDNWWIKELVSVSGVLEFWPARATPADLETLSSAPKEVWAGRLGAARTVLRTIMGHRITTGTFEPMVVEADALAGEFVAADEPQFVQESPPSEEEVQP